MSEYLNSGAKNIKGTKRKVKFLLFFLIIPLLFSSCASRRKIVEPLVQKPIEWKQISSPEEISGVWTSENGCVYEWPLMLNGKKYLRYSWEESDVTDYWVNYASKNNIAFSELWAHRFSYLGKIHMIDLGNGQNALSPVSDSSGNQMGFKLREDRSSWYSSDIPFRIMLRIEFLMTEETVRKNLTWFEKAGDKMIRENGQLNFYSEIFSFLTADDRIYYRKNNY